MNDHDTLPRSVHCQNYLLPADPAHNTARHTFAVMVGFFLLMLMDGLIIRHFELSFLEAIIFLLLALSSAIWGMCAAMSFRAGGNR